MSTSAWSQPSDALINNLKQSSQQSVSSSQASASESSKKSSPPAQTSSSSAAPKNNKKTKGASSASQQGAKSARKEGGNIKENGSSRGNRFNTRESTALFERLNTKAEQATEKGPFIFSDKPFDNRSGYYPKKKSTSVRFEEELGKFGVALSTAGGKKRAPAQQAENKQ